MCPPQLPGLLRFHLVSGRFHTEKEGSGLTGSAAFEGKDEARTLQDSALTPHAKGALAERFQARKTRSILFTVEMKKVWLPFLKPSN